MNANQIEKIMSDTGAQTDTLILTLTVHLKSGIKFALRVYFGLLNAQKCGLNSSELFFLRKIHLSHSARAQLIHFSLQLVFLQQHYLKGLMCH